MTVSQIRELMMERVVPESLLPQNIPASLMDEDSAPPELDAFTFLNRLRSLGIGSADFLYLLKGCGAPAEAVEKIEQHPDMNLQSLIVTLDGSGLTPKDYTRMLYTARQLWERTITMRLELDELQEAEAQSRPEPEPEPEQKPVSAVRTARQKKPAEERELPEKPLPRTARQKRKNEQEFREYAGVKPIGRRGVPEEEEEESSDPEVFTAVQLNLPPQADELPDEPEADTEPEEEAPAREDDPRGRRNAIIACAVGAAIVCAADIGVGALGFTAPEHINASLHFAADTGEIFSEIYEAYQSGKVGGENVQTMAPDVQIFGDMLISSGEQLGTYSDGATIWTAQPDMITVSALSADSASVTAQIVPPEGAQFLKVIRTDSGITAVFSGEDCCGLTAVGSSGQEWLAEQSGELTDIYLDGDVIRLGSVYTPAYSASFSVSDELAYMPWTSVGGEQTVFSPGETALTGTAQGCGYAVNVEYSQNGGIGPRMAVLGDPVYSGAEFFTAALRQESGTLLIGLNSRSELTCTAVPGITAMAAGNGLTACAESSDSGVTVYLRDRDMNTVGAFSSAGGADSMVFSGNALLLGNGGIITMAADVTDPGVPAPLTLNAADGVVSGEYALCGSTSAAGISLTLYRLEDGKAVQADSFSKTLTAGELESFRFCGANTFVVNGEDCSGAAYSWFDGVSVVSEFSEMGKSRSVHTLYDDPDGYTAAVCTANGLTLICGSRVQ